MPLLNLILFLVVGIAAGWIASTLVRGHGVGLLGNLVVGVIGAIVGGFLFGLLGLQATSLLGTLIMAVIGAIVLLVIINVLRRV